jgi:ceramide glucosyltransferase
VWALVALCAKAWPVAVAALTVRLLAGIATAGLVLHDRSAMRSWFFIPFRDLVGFAVWLAGLAGSTVEWRGEKIRLTKDGRIVKRDEKSRQR